jgi:hypothetical protein
VVKDNAARAVKAVAAGVAAVVAVRMLLKIRLAEVAAKN